MLPELTVSIATAVTKVGVALRADHVIASFRALDVDLHTHAHEHKDGQLSITKVQHIQYAQVRR